MSAKARQMARLAALMEARFMAGQGALRARLAAEAQLTAALRGLDEARGKAMADACDPQSFSPAHARATNAWLKWTQARKAVINTDLARARAATGEAREGLGRAFGQMQASRKLARRLAE